LVNGLLELGKKLFFFFSFDNFIGPWEHGVCFQLVDTEFSFFHLLFGFEHANAGDIANEKKKEKWRIESPDTSWNSQGNDIDAPP